MFVRPGPLLVTADVSSDDTLRTVGIDGAVEEVETDLRAADDRISLGYVEPEL